MALLGLFLHNPQRLLELFGGAPGVFKFRLALGDAWPAALLDGNRFTLDIHI